MAPIRASRSLFLSISRMLDMGGIPSASSKTRVRPIDASKNCKVRAIAFDFDLLTRSVDAQKSREEEETAQRLPKSASSTTQSQNILPDSNMVQKVAKLLNVELGKTGKSKKRDEDDLSALTGEERPKPTSKNSSPSGTIPSSGNPLSFDIRDKYAAKLRKKVDGGVEGIERSKQDIKLNLSGGDAAGHLAARAIAVSQGSSDQKWMALTGTGALLQYVSNRNMKLALLPVPSNQESAKEGTRMQNFTKQLPHVSFDLLLKDGENASDIINEMLHNLELEALVTMVVSDRDDYLKVGKEAGMITCRVRIRPNAPRGNISAHYNVRSVSEVQDVINDINGISFNAVFAAGSTSN